MYEFFVKFSFIILDVDTCYNVQFHLISETSG